ncbi:phytanoyl-CoA dioxygenase family protein [Micromonospora yasonensis]|uniref:phytanoyl-CoA dioxygenase family protein n=1 Tax=Micromonospora yasonensis TaxID=1128667 RepID=UPI0022319D9E|nr:phytanoyl-CoA dioxygenase family protein [Micromonospora yasonensis]MCW3844896.1 phytanoyl-CoA dioxygenase family protein [Micromonospora yasonensis]
MTTTVTELDQHYTVSPEDIAHYAKDGYVKLRGVLSPDVVTRYEPEITAQVIRLNTQHLPLSERDTYSRAFLQVINLWQHSDTVREFTFSRRLAGIAAHLLGVPAVRLYHDQALYKEAGGGITPWHVDQHYWPLSTDRTVTAWVPLQDTPAELGPLTFAAGSHRSQYGRELAIGDESEAHLEAFVTESGCRVDDSPYAIGDVSFHTGWTIHRAPGNTSATPRRVMTVIYMDAAIEVAQPTNRYQEADLAAFLGGRTIGSVTDGPLNPVLWSA